MTSPPFKLHTLKVADTELRRSRRQQTQKKNTGCYKGSENWQNLIWVLDVGVVVVSNLTRLKWSTFWVKYKYLCILLPMKTWEYWQLRNITIFHNIFLIYWDAGKEVVQQTKALDNQERGHTFSDDEGQYVRCADIFLVPAKVTVTVTCVMLWALRPGPKLKH